MFANGQALNTSDYPALSTILKQRIGLKADPTFTLPNPQFGLIIAVAGTFPTSPTQLAQMGRHMTYTDSLGPGARPALAAVSTRQTAIQQKRAEAVRAAQQLRASAIQPSSRGSGPLSADASARIDQGRDDARTAALNVLGPASRSLVESVVNGMLSGRLALHDAQLQMAAALTVDDSHALLAVHDALQRTFRPGWTGMDHPEPQAEAGRFIVDVAFTREQQHALAALPDNH